MAFSKIAYKALQDIVGKENVSDDPVVCQSYSRIQWTPDGVVQRNRIGVDMRPACVVLPGSAEEVQGVIRVANRYKFPFIPRGTGMINSAFPNRGGSMVIDPKRMNRIIKIDEKNMYAIVEPYVCFAELQAEAMKKGLYCPTPPAGSQISVLANYSWHGAYSNSWISGLGAHNLLAFEWVLPDGELVYSGSAAIPGGGYAWNDGPGPDLRGLLRGAQFGHAGGLGMTTKISCKLYPWPGPTVFPTEGVGIYKKSKFPEDKFRWYMIDFPHEYPKDEEWALKKAAELFYELAKAEIGVVVQHMAEQFLITYSSRTKQELFERLEKRTYPHGYCLVGLAATTSTRQLEYEEKVLKTIVGNLGGVFLTEKDPAYEAWVMNVGNEWIRVGHAQRLARPSDCFHQGTVNLDSIDSIVKEILRANREQRANLESEGKLGAGLLQPLSVHGGWISPLEGGYSCIMTTDTYPEQTLEGANEALAVLFQALKGQLGVRSPGAVAALIGPAYDLLGPMFYNVHLIVKQIKKSFDPNNVSNPPYATKPEVISPEELQKLVQVL
jgi:glycolate oxidase